MLTRDDECSVRNTVRHVVEKCYQGTHMAAPIQNRIILKQLLNVRGFFWYGRQKDIFFRRPKISQTFAKMENRDRVKQSSEVSTSINIPSIRMPYPYGYFH